MLIVYVLLCLCFFILGYVLGRLNKLIDSIGLSNYPKNESFISSISKEQKANKKSIQIDEKKFVTDLGTDGMQPGGDQSLGSIHQTEDNVSLAANKLAQLKRSKG